MTLPKIGVVVRKKSGAPQYNSSQKYPTTQIENNNEPLKLANPEAQQQFAAKIFALVR